MEKFTEKMSGKFLKSWKNQKNQNKWKNQKKTKKKSIQNMKIWKLKNIGHNNIYFQKKIDKKVEILLKNEWKNHECKNRKLNREKYFQKKKKR